MADAVSSVRDFAADKYRKARSYMGADYSQIPMEGVDPDDDEGLGLDEAGGDSCCSSLTRRERITGFLVCFVAGWILSFSSVSALDAVMTDPGQFAVLYTLGNIVSLLGTTCLRGPSAQIERMFAPARRFTTLIYLMAIVMTLVCALVLHSPLLALLCMAFQCCAMLWYSLSYIPYGHALATRCFRTIFPCCPGPDPSQGSFAGRVAADASEAWGGARAWAGFGAPHSPISPVARGLNDSGEGLDAEDAAVSSAVDVDTAAFGGAAAALKAGAGAGLARGPSAVRPTPISQQQQHKGKKGRGGPSTYYDEV